MRELREFRVRHDEFRAHGLAVAGITRDTPESNRHWARRLEIPYLLLSDMGGAAGRAFGVTRRVALAGWSIEFFRRATFLVDEQGQVAAVWGKVRIRGHALEVLGAARALARAAG